MIFLYVILGILLTILIILFLPIHVIIFYKESLIVKIRILFFNFTLFSANKTHDSKSKKKIKIDKTLDNKNNLSITDFINKKGFSGFIEFVSDITKLGVTVILNIIKRISIKELKLEISIGDENSASTAIKFGQTCAIVYPLLSLITSNNSPKIYNVNIYPDYSQKECMVNFKLHIYTKIFYFIHSAWMFIKGYLQINKVN